MTLRASDNGRKLAVVHAGVASTALVGRDAQVGILRALVSTVAGGRGGEVQRAVAQLQPLHREVLRLIYFDGRTCAEAAAVLGVPAGTVRSRLHYALRHLRHILGDNRSVYK